MNPDKFAKLPVGSVVVHKNSVNSCAYRKHEDGGWQLASKDAPHAPITRPHYDSGFRVNLGDGSNCTLIERPQKKSARIAELEHELADTQEALATTRRLHAVDVAEVQRLRNVIRAARGTLGPNF